MPDRLVVITVQLSQVSGAGMARHDRTTSYWAAVTTSPSPTVILYSLQPPTLIDPVLSAQPGYVGRTVAARYDRSSNYDRVCMFSEVNVARGSGVFDRLQMTSIRRSTILIRTRPDLRPGALVGCAVHPSTAASSSRQVKVSRSRLFVCERPECASNGFNNAPY
jgi:hypothetical protein